MLLNEDKYISVSHINKYIKNKIDTDENLNYVYLRAEISNFKNHTRGHLYFTLKDDDSRISAVMFATQAKSLVFIPEDGMKVLIEGRVSVYEANGGYQIYVNKMTEDGVGKLHYEYEKLKQKLQIEGLFDNKYKKNIPQYPRKIGIITASTGAAIKDIISTIKRRYPVAETILFPSLVQGDGAKENIVKQIEEANKHDLDVIICGRGGGSIEDLWAFNEEIVVRAIFVSNIPIISAVGHEVDFTIADFVADLRAPTPTGAAEMAVPDIKEIKNNINQHTIRLNESINNTVKYYKTRFDSLKNTYVLKNPMALFEIKEQRLDNYIESLNNNMKLMLTRYRNQCTNINNSYVLKNPVQILDSYKNKMAIIISKLKVLNPLNILENGYSMVTLNGSIIDNANKVKKNDLINIKLHQGTIIANVERVEE